MAQVTSSQLQGKPQDTGADGKLDVTPDTTAPLKPGKYIFSVVVTDDIGLDSAPATWPVEIRDVPGIRLSGPKVVAFNQTISLAADVQTTGAVKNFSWSVKQVG